MSTNPSDEEILALLRTRRSDTMPTYYIKNVLRTKYARLQTAWVLRRMKAMEKAGLVKRTGISSNSFCWAAA